MINVKFKLQDQKAKMISSKDGNTLLNTLIKYVIPIFNKDKNKKHSKLEEIVDSKKVKLKPLDLIFLEDLVNSFLKKKEGIKIIKKPEIIELPDFEINDKNNKNDAEEIRYSVAFEKKKEVKDDFGYAVEIKYEENETEEKLDIKIQFNDSLENYSINKNAIYNKNQKNKDKKEYSITIKRDKENKSKDNYYSVSLIYENNYEEERLSINYKSTIGTYLNRRHQALHDFSDRVPGKHVNIFPESVMGGILGFTYLGENFMGLRADLTGDLKKMVDIHESIHTPDEYETRCLTQWIMSKEKIVKYNL